MTALALFAPVVVCCIGAYLRWQLGDVALTGVASRSASGVEPFGHDGEPLAAEIPGRTASAPKRVASLAVRRLTALPKGPGVYVASCRDARAEGCDAAIRGQMLADRIINGRFEARRALRRGRKGALDVIVVGANALGVSAARSLAHAGLRVLMVDSDGAEFTETPRGNGEARLPLLTGHAVSEVAERADGMLEVQAERAAWYTANVIFASSESLSAASEWAAPARRSPAPRAA
jgi:hypothetical protein